MVVDLLMKNKAKIRRLRHHQKQQELIKQKTEKELEERKIFLLLRKRKRKAETAERSKQFFEDRAIKWNQQRNAINLAIPSEITPEGGKCVKKRSPLDLY